MGLGFKVRVRIWGRIEIWVRLRVLRVRTRVRVCTLVRKVYGVVVCVGGGGCATITVSVISGW